MRLVRAAVVATCINVRNLWRFHTEAECGAELDSFFPLGERSGPVTGTFVPAGWDNDEPKAVVVLECVTGGQLRAPGFGLGLPASMAVE